MKAEVKLKKAVKTALPFIEGILKSNNLPQRILILFVSVVSSEWTRAWN